MSLSEFIAANETPIRLAFFVGIFVLMAIWELIAPKRALTISKLLRWSNNIGLVVLNTAILRLIFPAAAIGVALFAEQQGWGLLNYLQAQHHFSLLLSIILAVIALDLVIYLQHVLVHAIPALWRLHRVHHADLDYDLTTGARFHPIEILFSMVIKISAIITLGAPVVAVIIFEIILNATSMFNHGNVRIPKAIDTIVRLVLVTPDMHRVHHSIEDDETNSNFGFSLSIWDRLFGTYRDQPRAGHQAMTIGIREFRSTKEASRLWGMLRMPFIGQVKDYAINRRRFDQQMVQQDNESTKG